jgi:DHA1 family bicyclomycin/chloramphenicol resistance-like MFS transporter
MTAIPVAAANDTFRRMWLPHGCTAPRAACFRRGRMAGILPDFMAPISQPLPTLVLVLSAALGPFAMHLLVPAIPLLASDFAVPYGTAQLVVPVYLVGFSVAQLVYGPLSDRFGRKPVLLAGVGLFLVATAICTFARSIESLLLARALQAVGGVAGMVLSRAIVADCYGRDRAAAVLGYITMAIVICSLASPIAGGFFSSGWGWRASFLALLLPALFVLLMVHFRLRETNLHLQPSISFASLARAYGSLLRHRIFMAMAIAVALNSASWFAFIATMPFIMVTQLGRPAHDYGLLIAVVSTGYMIGNFLAGRYSARIGTRRMMAAGVIVMTIGALLVPLGAFLAPTSLVGLFLPMTVTVLGGGLFMPNATATGLSTGTHNIGAASGLMGFIQMSLSAVATVLVGVLHDGTAMPMVAVVTGTTLLGTAIMIGPLRRPPAQAA